MHIVPMQLHILLNTNAVTNWHKIEESRMTSCCVHDTAELALVSCYM